MIKVISFDLDGTLADESFDKKVWNEEIPKLYAEEHGVSVEDAKLKVYSEYYIGKFVRPTKEWTNIEYWFKHFGLSDWEKIIEDMKNEVFLFEDTIPALESLAGHKKIIISSSHRHFLDAKVEAEGLNNFFEKTFSAPDFGSLLKDRKMFQKIIEELGIKPEEMVHVGDEYDRDYEIPLSLGIKAFFLDRNGKMEANHVIHSLSELNEKINGGKDNGS